jgi:galactonate dehydratase
MKITDIKPLLLDRFLFVEIMTDKGITGLGESGSWAFLEASAQAVNTFKRYLVGQDPLRIEHHWQYLYRWAHFRGAAIMGALSAIDIALWDIAGKYFDVPSYQLLTIMYSPIPPRDWYKHAKTLERKVSPPSVT